MQLYNKMFDIFSQINSSSFAWLNENIGDANKEKSTWFKSCERVQLHANRHAICPANDTVEPKQKFVLKWWNQNIALSHRLEAKLEADSAARKYRRQ